MATFSPSYGTNSALTVTNLHSLADAAFWESAAQDNATDKGQVVEVFVTLGTTTTSGDSTGYANIYLAGSNDGGTDYAGTSPDGTESTETFNASQERNMDPIGRVPIDASETTARTFKQRFIINLPPEDYVIVIENQTGAALASSGNLVEIKPIQGTDA